MQSLFAKAAVARRAGRAHEAEAAYREWIDTDPADPAPRYGLALLLLQRGAYAEGWNLYESRSQVAETGIRKPTLSFPEWRGEPVRSLLIWPEQGLGDQIMFARFVPELLARGITVTLLSPPPLVRLFEAFGASIIPAAGGVSLPPHEAWCLIGSLPHLIGTIPVGSYLTGAAGGSGLGVVATGNPGHVNDARRSLPEPYGSQLLALGRSLDPAATGARDLEDTRQIIAGLEGVVTVDTSVAHLAGAMGKPVTILLPHDADWRWGQSGERSIWYPSARLLRQPSPGDWRSVLDQIGTLTT